EKIILFELEGDVSAGQSLSVTVGQRTATYDTIVPSSAIRSDDNGKFVLRVNTKSTPLGNRYIAERVDVTVLAEDETRTAVSGEFTGWDYIITTVTKPVEDGQQVRLKD
ncbi:MAG: RND transporter, partial [Lachnospiraceae bacterium]|nr:RND transporter [Lachnospiraceae bacterium]